MPNHKPYYNLNQRIEMAGVVLAVVAVIAIIIFFFWLAPVVMLIITSVVGAWLWCAWAHDVYKQFAEAAYRCEYWPEHQESHDRLDRVEKEYPRFAALFRFFGGKGE